MQKMMKLFLYSVILVVLSLHATPVPLFSFPEAAQSIDKVDYSSFTFTNNQLYILDNANDSIIRYSPHSKDTQTLITDKVLLSKMVDITSDDKYLYVIDANKPQIIILDFNGKIIRTFSTPSSTECELKNPVRILVNYQGTMYIMDTNRNQILSFTNEGFFLKAYNCINAVSMTLGIDQNIRLLALNEERYQIDVISPDLSYIGSIMLQDINAGKGELADIAINDYCETYLVNSTKCQIAKVDDMGNIIPNSSFGAKAKKASVGIFSKPVMVKTSIQNDIPILAILDAKLQSIQFYEDREFNPAKRLQKPAWSMRIALSENESLPFIDFMAVDSLRYYIREFTDNSGIFATVYRTLSCESPTGNVFEIKTVGDKNKKLFSFDYMTIIGDSLYVTDSQNNNVNVWQRKTGQKLFSFGEKGNGSGQLKSPSGITHDKENNLYICDKDNHRISVFSRYGIFMRNIVKQDVLVSPSQIIYNKTKGLMVLSNQNSVVELDPLGNKTDILLTREKISCIDYCLNDWLTVVDELTQNVLFFDGKKEVMRFGASISKNDRFFFKKINAIRFNPLERILYLSDLTSQSTKLVKFYLPPLIPRNLKLIPALASETNAVGQQIAKLTWDYDTSALRWIVYAYTAADTSYYSADTNQLILDKPQSETIRYKVSAVSEDNRLSQLTTFITDDYTYARYLENTGNHLQAIEVYRKFNEYNKVFSIQAAICRNYYALAQSSISQMDYDNALTYFKLARNFSTQPDTIVTQIIKIYKQTTAWQQGINFLLSLDDNSVFNQREMLSLLYLSEDYAGTAQCAENLIKAGQDNVGVRQYLASAKEKLHLYNEALDAYRQIAKLSPTVQNQLKVAEMLIKLSNYDEAIVFLQKLYTQNLQSNADEIQFMLGLAYLDKQLYGRASDCFSEALRLDNTNSEYYYQLGYSYLLDRKTSEAIQNLKKAYQLQPESFIYGFELAQLYDKESKLNEALDLLDNIRSFVPSDSSASLFHLFYGNVLMQKKRYDDAYRELQAALKMHPDDQAIKNKFAEVIQARTQYNQNREPLEIKQTVFEQIYPSQLEYYRTHSIGYITLFNTRNVPINDIKLTVNVPEITALPLERIIPSILAGEEAQIDISLEFSPTLLDKCEQSSQDFTASISLDYIWDKQPKKITENKIVSALKVQAMNWENRKQLACFINPADENIRNYGLNILNTMKVPPSTELPKNITQAMQIYSWLSAKGLHYISDPAGNDVTTANIDYVQFPYQTLKNNGGDCDDLLVLTSSIFAGIGINAAFIDLPEHVIPAFDTGMNIEDIEKYGFNRADFIIRGNVIWMPLETTLIGKENFYRSWKSSVERYKQTMDSGMLPDFFVFNDARQTYPPVNYTKPIAKDTDAFASQAIAHYNLDWENMTNASFIAIEEEYLKTLKLYPANLSYKNRFALWYVDNGKTDKAKKVWIDILSEQPNHYSALINLGNLELIDSHFEQAKSYYQQAMATNPSQKDSVLRNLCILEYRAGNISFARDYFKQIQDSSTLRRLNPKMYLELLQ